MDWSGLRDGNAGEEDRKETPYYLFTLHLARIKEQIMVVSSISQQSLVCSQATTDD